MSLPLRSVAVRCRLMSAAPMLALSLVACAASPSAPQPASTDWAPLLQGYRWQLASAIDAGRQGIAALQPRSDRPLVLSFDPEGRMGVRGGCNQIGGAYAVSASGALTVSQLMSTRMACEPALMQMDAAISALLAQPAQLSLEPAAQGTAPAPRLRLTTGNQASLVLIGQPTAETRYGGPATLVFMEVAPRRVACTHPLIPSATCLQVRERSYDARGMSSGTPGPWQPLYGEIEGYTHTEGLRNVLRVKRFQRTGPLPADAPSTALVLDMVIESERTAP